MREAVIVSTAITANRQVVPWVFNKTHAQTLLLKYPGVSVSRKIYLQSFRETFVNLHYLDETYLFPCPSPSL